jgi:hypothetical protein
MRQTLQDFGYHFTKIPLLCDNERSIKLANHPVSHSRTKHIDITSSETTKLKEISKFAM